MSYGCGSQVRCACGNKAVVDCAFALKGRKAGQTCGKPLCARCAHGDNRCLAHFNYERERRDGSE